MPDPEGLFSVSAELTKLFKVYVYILQKSSNFKTTLFI